MRLTQCTEDDLKETQSRMLATQEKRARNLMASLPEGMLSFEDICAVVAYATDKGLSLREPSIAVIIKKFKGQKTVSAEKFQKTLYKLQRKTRPHLKYTWRMKRFNALVRLGRKIKRYKSPLSYILDKGQDRAYFDVAPLDKQSKTEAAIDRYLKTKGYSILSYKEGYARDAAGKQKFKIGKLLKQNQELAKAYEQDGTRYTENHRIVVSSQVDDLLHMSTGRGWESCMAINGMKRKHLVKDTVKPIMIAYLIRKNDLDISNPLGRVLIRPFKNKKGETAYFVGDPYGFHDEAFLKTVEDIARTITKKINGGKHPGGFFNLTKGLYADGSYTVYHFPKTMTAEAFLESLNINYTSRDDGTIFISGSLNLRDKKVKHLPDLSKIVVEEDIDVSFCDLETLQGMPQSCRNFYCIGNDLKDLKGAPQTIEGTLICRKNPLESFEGAPKGVEIIHAPLPKTPPRRRRRNHR